ncbi:MAG: stage II sporulation protein R, partial [Clostridia bacterium]|nr:stage II sporulation protein R [Clostridia bacterium]
MKKICISLFLISIIILTVTVSSGSQNEQNEYLRIHIRANSNSVEDQNVKYEIKEALVKYLTPFIANCNTKKQAISLIKNKQSVLTKIANEI